MGSLVNPTDHRFKDLTHNVQGTVVHFLQTTPSKKNPPISQWLLAQGWISHDQLAVALKEKSRSSKPFETVVQDLGFISSEQLLQALSALSGLPFISLQNHILDGSVVQKIPQELATADRMILFQEDNEGFHLAMADPEDLLALDKVRVLLGTHHALIPYYTTPRDIAHVLEVYYPQPTINTHDGEVVRIVHELILEAVRLKASDIHFSPLAQTVVIQYRQDGLLRQAHTLHKERWSALCIRLKIMASLDIAESRRPQNGSFRLTLDGREIDFRLSCHPTIHGENLVVRILDKSHSLRPLDELGFDLEVGNTLKRLVMAPQGLIILSGPTGSGKTTTLYALLRYMNASARNIMTLEEPVEYHLPNIHQTEIREDGPFRFAEGIRSLLRQDPDVIFISEIRDGETAQMALRASLTGHLVFATLHARDCSSIPHRLIDLGVSPEILWDNLTAGLSQRLIRRLCEKCRHPKIISSIERTRYSLPPSITHTYQAGSCPTCQHTGYKGREVVAELRLFTTGSPTPPQTLKDHGIQKVLRGITTFEEIERTIGI